MKRINFITQGTEEQMQHECHCKLPPLPYNYNYHPSLTMHTYLSKKI